MSRLLLTEEDARSEIERIISFLRQGVEEERQVVIGLSGGLDSDVVARLAIRALYRQRIKLFTAIQDEMEDRHLANARAVAAELEIPLVEIDLAGLPQELVRRMGQADPSQRFRPEGLLDPARMKCALRTVVLSSYQDRGLAIVGTSNRTELDLGFFLPLGDGLCHLAPIAHLYKSEVRELARGLGTAQEVLDQAPSAGFWKGQEDLEDLSYWLYCREPIAEEREFDESAVAEVQRIRSELTTVAIDHALVALSAGASEAAAAEESGLSSEIVSRIRQVAAAARSWKHRPLGESLYPMRSEQHLLQEGHRAH